MAGRRREVADDFHAAIDAARMGNLVGDTIQVQCATDFDTYVREFNALLADTDILWTKPSELSFFAALGLPLVMAWPVGVHERYNRRWVLENGAGIKQRDPRVAGEWLGELLHDGTLAQAAFSGFMHLPKFGTYRILERLRQ